MDHETFRKGVQRIRGFWPIDKIVSDEPDKLVVQCSTLLYGD